MFILNKAKRICYPQIHTSKTMLKEDFKLKENPHGILNVHEWMKTTRTDKYVGPFKLLFKKFSLNI